jgi:hypothetical protein
VSAPAVRAVTSDLPITILHVSRTGSADWIESFGAISIFSSYRPFLSPSDEPISHKSIPGQFWRPFTMERLDDSSRRTIQRISATSWSDKRFLFKSSKFLVAQKYPIESIGRIFNGLQSAREVRLPSYGGFSWHSTVDQLIPFTMDLRGNFQIWDRPWRWAISCPAHFRNGAMAQKL